LNKDNPLLFEQGIVFSGLCFKMLEKIWMMLYSEIAPLGQTLAQVPHSVHISASIV